MSCVSHIYSTFHYDKLAERINFDIHNEKTSISKNQFCTLLGLAHEPTMVNPNSITTGQLFSMFYIMGRTETLTRVTKFKKLCLPPQWNGLFTLLFKVSCSRFWSIVTKWAMDRLHVPIMVDSLLSSIATFHTTKILATDPSKYLLIGSIPACMYAYMSEESAIIQEYNKHPSSGLRELTHVMIRSIEEADKPSKRGKKNKKRRRKDNLSKELRGKLQESESLTRQHLHSLSRKRPRSLLGSLSFSPQAIPILSISLLDINNPLQAHLRPKALMRRFRFVVIPHLTRLHQRYLFVLKHLLLHLFPFLPLSQLSHLNLLPLFPFLHLFFPKLPLPPLREFKPTYLIWGFVHLYPKPLSPLNLYLLPIQPKPTLFLESMSMTPLSPMQQRLLMPLLLNAKRLHLLWKPLQKTSRKRPQKRSLEAELSQLGVSRKAIEAANGELLSKVDDQLTQLKAELAVENKVMDEMDKRASQLKIQNLKLRTATKELDDLKRHLGEKLRPTLDILSRIEGVSETVVFPKQGGEKKSQEREPDKTQPPPPREPKSTVGPKDHVASASKGQKKKKIIGEDDEDEDDDIDNIIKGAPSKPDPKFKPSDQELREKMDRLEKEMKENELLEKKKSMFPEWTIESL
uniref:Uncharacterized protein n=1 Tax=Lactuca sativa TaxID=4236 RepID=A0A9R1XIE8_LACSA|nr:hypothetical protein LSAT_V11C400220120 [Lactuca sativa]